MCACCDFSVESIYVIFRAKNNGKCKKYTYLFWRCSNSNVIIFIEKWYGMDDIVFALTLSITQQMVESSYYIYKLLSKSSVRLEFMVGKQQQWK